MNVVVPVLVVTFLVGSFATSLAYGGPVMGVVVAAAVDAPAVGTPAGDCVLSMLIVQVPCQSEDMSVMAEL